jgi:hypothetical protein
MLRQVPDAAAVRLQGGKRGPCHVDVPPGIVPSAVHAGVLHCGVDVPVHMLPCCAARAHSVVQTVLCCVGCKCGVWLQVRRSSK